MEQLQDRRLPAIQSTSLLIHVFLADRRGSGRLDHPLDL